jgi:hypothetical protein
MVLPVTVPIFLQIASTFAAAGFVTVAIDLPLHGLPSSNKFYKNNY